MTTIERFSTQNVWEQLAADGRLELSRELRPALLAIAESRSGLVTPVVAFFYSNRDLIELPPQRDQPANLSGLGHALGWPPVAAPRVEPARAKAALGSSWGGPNTRRLYILIPAALAPGLGVPKGEPLWVVAGIKRSVARLVVVSANTGEILALMPLKLRLGAFIPISAKIVMLCVLGVATLWLGPTGYGAIAAFLGILILIVWILAEMAAARKGVAPPAPGPGAAPGGGGGGAAPNPFDPLLKRARELKEKIDKKVKDNDEFDPLDPDVKQAKKLGKDVDKAVDNAEDDAGASKDEKKDLKKALDDANGHLPK